MASIVYVCEREMIEFHRLYSHRQIVFWRLSTKQFTNFKENDFLFFLVKTRRKERGILGFGRLVKPFISSPHKMWQQAAMQTGYATEQAFKQAILQVSKQPQLPLKIGGLWLKDVTYFKSPIYLSEFNYALSQNIESYTYIDTTDNLTSKILEQALAQGFDTWSEQMGEVSEADKVSLLSKTYLFAQQAKQSELFNSQKQIKRAKDYKRKHPKSEQLFDSEGIVLHANKVHLFCDFQKMKECYGVLGFCYFFSDREYPLVIHLLYPIEEHLKMRFVQCGVEIEVDDCV